MENIESQFRSIEPSLRRLEEEAKHILTTSIERSNIKVHAILSRVKTVESIAEKCARKNLLGGMDEIDDVVGVRVVCLLRSDLRRLGEIVRAEFKVLSEDNKVDGATVDAFGYQSVHFVSRLKKSLRGPRYEGLHDFRLEIQLRSVAMDTWATLSHYLDYKSESDVPKELRKDFFALSGLFYVADTHFEMFYDARQRSLADAQKDAKNEPPSMQGLDLDVFRAYLLRRYPDRGHSEFNAVSEVLAELRSAGYSDLGSVHARLENAAEVFGEYEALNPPGNKPGARYADVGVVRLSMGLIRSGGQVDYAFATGAREAFSYPAGLT